jgi:anti-sigma factor RsiW
MSTDDMACRELVEVVTELLEDALAPEERARIKEHLAGCDGCTAHLAQIKATLRVAGSLRDETRPAPETEEALVGLFRTWVAEGP